MDFPHLTRPLFRARKAGVSHGERDVHVDALGYAGIDLASRAPALEQPAIRPDADAPPDGDKGAGAPADEDTPDPDEYADPDAPSR